MVSGILSIAGGGPLNIVSGSWSMAIGGEVNRVGGDPLRVGGC